MQTPTSLVEYLNLRETTKNNNMITVVKYTADWCNVCKAIQPKLNNLVREFPNVLFISYDVECFENEETENIRALPTFKIFDGNHLVEEFAGDNLERIANILKQYLNRR